MINFYYIYVTLFLWANTHKKHTTVTVVQSPWGGVVPPTENLALPTSCSVEIMQMLLLIFNY